MPYMSTLKKPITVRIDSALLERVRASAARDNRSVTNYIETALRRQLEPGAPGVHRAVQRGSAARSVNGGRR
jgi:hypothetical protein